jgi:hypothetical protein
VRPFVAAALIGISSASVATAQDAQSDSAMKSVLKIVGFATDVKPPPDFVQQSRPAQAPALIPAFVKSPEPPGTAKSAKQVEDIDSEMEAISKKHDALRASFPPSAKAVADAAAAKAAKAKTKGKTAQKSPLPSF